MGAYVQLSSLSVSLSIQSSHMSRQQGDKAEEAPEAPQLDQTDAVDDVRVNDGWRTGVLPARHPAGRAGFLSVSGSGISDYEATHAIIKSDCPSSVAAVEVFLPTLTSRSKPLFCSSCFLFAVG